MTGKIEHNTGEEGAAGFGAPTPIAVRSEDLPMIITLELEDGSKKRYHLSFAKKAEGLILNKAV